MINKNAATEPEQHFIPGIYNYCDRWCERCSMTTSCLLNALENADNRANSGFFECLETRLDLLSDLMILLNDESLSEAGAFDSELLSEAMPVSDDAEHELIKLTHDYAREVDVWLLGLFNPT